MPQNTAENIEVSIIIPCRDEEHFIGKCLDSIANNDYPKGRLEVLVIDGMSTDSTRDVIGEFQDRYGFIRLISNPRKITPVGLNIGIKASRGDFILWMSAHNAYESEYITRCLKHLKESNADAVGGIIKPIPRSDGFTGKCVCIALSHPFGVGNSAHKTGASRPQYADTALGTCYKREVFDRIGVFNENLVRGQDMEFALRLKKAGLRNLLVPELKSYYYARSDLNSLRRHYWKNGVWAILPFLYSEVMPISWRHIVPLVFVSSLILSALLSVMGVPFWWVFLGIVLMYAIADLIASSHITWRERDFRYLVVMPLIFVVLHVSYGLGSLWGVIKLLTEPSFWKKLMGKSGVHSEFSQ